MFSISQFSNTHRVISLYNRKGEHCGLYEAIDLEAFQEDSCILVHYVIAFLFKSKRILVVEISCGAVFWVGNELRVFGAVSNYPWMGGGFFCLVGCFCGFGVVLGIKCCRIWWVLFFFFAME